MNENKLSLTEVFKNEQVVENINKNIFNDKENLDKVLQKVISFDKCTAITIGAKIKDRDIVFENTLHHKDVYLLESRAFDADKDEMLGVYLQTLDSDGNILDLNETHDDVWSTKWSKAITHSTIDHKEMPDMDENGVSFVEWV